MYVTKEEFEKFTGVHSDIDSLQLSYIVSAENIVENYLGYSPEKTKYNQTFNGRNSFELQLKAKPIRELLKVVINGTEVPVENFEFNNEFICYKKLFPYGFKNISVVYIAGYGSSDISIGDGSNNEGGIDGGNAELENEDAVEEIKNYDDMPDIIKLTVLRIAALLQSESDNNIGVTSKSFGESGTRTFINTVNFDKYLIQISKYKLLVI